jgi:hypothetical protein
MKVENLQYNGDFSDVVSIKDLERQAVINALCFTNTVYEASLEVGLTERTMYRHMSDYGINDIQLKMMRNRFKYSNQKIKKRFNLK